MLLPPDLLGDCYINSDHGNIGLLGDSKTGRNNIKNVALLLHLHLAPKGVIECSSVVLNGGFFYQIELGLDVWAYLFRFMAHSFNASVRKTRATVPRV